MHSIGSAQEILTQLKAGDNYLLLSHVHPDGDSVGSLLGLADLLQQMGKQVTIASTEEVAATFHFIPGIEQVRVGETELAADYEYVVAVDVSDYRRVGSLRSYLERAQLVINIDHHLGNEFGRPKYVRTSACATGELIYELFELAGLEPSYGAAIALYTAIVTDTGRFSHANTTAETFRIAANLVKLGVEPYQIFHQIYQRKDLGFIRLLGKVLASLQTACGGRVVYIIMDQAMLTEYSPDLGDSENYIAYAQMVEGVKIALLFRQLADGRTKVSWRSVPGVDVSVFAREFGGGGHANAAGCEIDLEPQQAAEKVLTFLDKHFC